MSDQQATPAESPRGRIINPLDLVKRFLLGVIGSCLFSAIMFFAHVKAFVAFLLAAILTFLGWTTQPPREVEEAGRKFIGRIEADAARVAPPMLGAGLIPLPGFAPKTPEQIEAEAARKEADRLRRLESRRNALLARADVLKLPCDPAWTLEKLESEVGVAGRRAAEASERKLLLARADKVALQPDPALDLEALRGQVAKAEDAVRRDADFQATHRAWEKAVENWERNRLHGSNARCPACRFLMRIGDARLNGKGVCPRCNVHFPCTQARALFTPPPRPKEPVPGARKKGLLGRIFG